MLHYHPVNGYIKKTEESTVIRDLFDVDIPRIPSTTDEKFVLDVFWFWYIGFDNWPWTLEYKFIEFCELKT